MTRPPARPRIRPMNTPSQTAATPPEARAANTEFEVKFLVDEATFTALQQSPLVGSPTQRTAHRLHSVYFDTEAADLARHRMALRVRSGRAGATLLGLKAEIEEGSDGFQRREIEVASPSPEPDPALLGEAAAAEIARITEGRTLLARFSSDIRRRTHVAKVRGSQIEIAFDTGAIVAGPAKQPVREVELELKSGDPADLFGFALSLTEAAPMRLGVLSKAARGSLLGGGEAPAALRATSPVTGPCSVDDVFAAIISACIRQFIGNWPAFENGNAAEAVHQMRVAMRRLRAALALFQRGFPCVEFTVLRGDAKRIASAMGEGRNWDVFADLVRAGPTQVFPDERGFDALLDASGTHRDEGHRIVDTMLKDIGTTRFVLSALGFVARRGWRSAVPGAELPRLSAPADGFAAQSLERLHRRVRKRGKNIVELPADERHEVRVMLKALRYATEFFGGLFPATATVRTYARTAARLQDVLGMFNDMVMVTDLVQRLQLGGDAGAARAAGILVGWYGRSAQVDQDELRHAWDAFRAAKPFWTGALPDTTPT
jgi:triphosphatase